MIATSDLDFPVQKFFSDNTTITTTKKYSYAQYVRFRIGVH